MPTDFVLASAATVLFIWENGLLSFVNLPTLWSLCSFIYPFYPSMSISKAADTAGPCLASLFKELYHSSVWIVMVIVIFIVRVLGVNGSLGL